MSAARRTSNHGTCLTCGEPIKLKKDVVVFIFKDDLPGVPIGRHHNDCLRRHYEEKDSSDT